MREKLGNLYKISSGGTPLKSNREYYEGGTIKWVKTGDLKQQYLYDSEDCITEVGLSKSSARMYEENTVLIAMYGATIGATSILKIPACTNQACAAFPPINSVIPEYLYYFLRSKKSQFVKDGVGGAQPNISGSYLKDVELDLLDLKEQKKIVNILDKIGKIILGREKQMKQLDNLIKSRFVEMFGDLAVNPLNWKQGQLIDLCSSKDDIKCGPFGTQLSKDEYQKEGVPLWGIPQINSSFLIMPSDYLSEDKAKKLEPYSIVQGDIVMSRKGNVGKCALYPDNLSRGIMHSDALRIRINSEEVNPMFLMQQLHNSRYVVNQIENVSSGAIMAGVNVTKLKTIYVHLPPIELQKQFATFVQQVDKLKVEAQKSLDEMQILFDSLMQKYFG